MPMRLAVLAVAAKSRTAKLSASMPPGTILRFVRPSLPWDSDDAPTPSPVPVPVPNPAAATAAMCDALTVDELLGGRELALDRGYVPPDVDLLGPGPLLGQA